MLDMQRVCGMLLKGHVQASLLRARSCILCAARGTAQRQVSIKHVVQLVTGTLPTSWFTPQTRLSNSTVTAVSHTVVVGGGGWPSTLAPLLTVLRRPMGHSLVTAATARAGEALRIGVLGGSISQGAGAGGPYRAYATLYKVRASPLRLTICPATGVLAGRWCAPSMAVGTWQGDRQARGQCSGLTQYYGFFGRPGRFLGFFGAKL